MITLDRIDKEFEYAEREILAEKLAVVRDEIDAEYKRTRRWAQYDYGVEYHDILVVAERMIRDVENSKKPWEQIIEERGDIGRELAEAIKSKYIERLAFGW